MGQFSVEKSVPPGSLLSGNQQRRFSMPSTQRPRHKRAASEYWLLHETWILLN